MAKIKYYYDTESCKYERIRVSRSDIFWNSMSFFIVALIIGIGIFLLVDRYFESPKYVAMSKGYEEVKFHNELQSNEIGEMRKMLSSLQERDDNLYRVMLGAEPIPESIRKAGFGGSDRYKELRGLSKEELIRKNYQDMDALKKQMYVQTKSYDEIVQLAKRKDDMLAAMPAIQPVSKTQLKWLTSGYGYRIHPIYRTRKKHTGVDYSVSPGTPIYATGDGVIERTEIRAGGYGKNIIVNHGFGFKSLYAHLSAFNVRKGQKVKRGELIGYSGSTGSSTGPHLHYEVIVNGVKRNPVHYMSKDVSVEEYQSILELAAKEGFTHHSY